MMKRFTMAALSLLGAMAAGSGVAQTFQCPAGTARVISGTPANPNNGTGDFTSFITGATICAVRGTDRWQEFHRSDGKLIDWKRGANDAVDPTKEVGLWKSVTGADAAVTHTYGITSFVWAICQVGTGLTYTLVSPTGGTVTGATIRAGQVACP